MQQFFQCFVNRSLAAGSFNVENPTPPQKMELDSPLLLFVCLCQNAVAGELGGVSQGACSEGRAQHVRGLREVEQPWGGGGDGTHAASW